MNIQTAAGYMEHGYRVRRAPWDEGEYVYNDRYFYGHCVMVPGMKKDADGKIISYTRPWHTTWQSELEDLIADDWELILEGIKNDFGQVQYEDK